MALVASLLALAVVSMPTPAPAQTLPTIQIAGALPPEPNVGKNVAKFTVTLSQPAPADTTYTYRLLDDTATGGKANDPLADYNDFGGETRTGRIRQGATSAFITVPVYGDRRLEPMIERFGVQLLSAPPGYDFGAARNAYGSIGDGEAMSWPVPSFSIGGAYAIQSPTGMVKASVAVSLSEPVTTETRVVIFWSPGGSVFTDDATPGRIGDPGVDFKPFETKQLIFRPGQVRKVVTVAIAPSAGAETEELIRLTLTNPEGGPTLGSTSGGVYIQGVPS